MTPMMLACVFTAMLASMPVAALVTMARTMLALRAMTLLQPGYISRRITVSHAVTEPPGISGSTRRVNPNRGVTGPSTIWIAVIATGLMSKDRSGKYQSKHSRPNNHVKLSHNDASFALP
jgi:hypothetical protein